ncbi:hypothetical protein ACFWWM_07320 [Streptomyces sp. NPDC058682]|uniref:hypothetical protein n=1 Tax=Streptomyces sp. NPDC058682 TaxID=3346596 RepID=UPI00365923ED
MGTTPDVDYLEVIGLRDPLDCAGGEGQACKDAAVSISIDLAISAATYGIGKVGKVLFKGVKASMKKGNGGVPIQCLVNAASVVNSFQAGTHVQLADGSSEPIEELENGDLVLATDPETGRTEAQPVAVVLKATRAFGAEQPTYNLTVASLHTYYVLAGGTAVLVHNDGEFDWEKGLEETSTMTARSLREEIRRRTRSSRMRCVPSKAKSSER